MFFTIDGRMFGSFTEKYIEQMYHFPESEKGYNKALLEAFAKENTIESDPMRQWRHLSTKHKHETLGMYSVDLLASPYCYDGAMMCKLFGVHDSAKFSIEMVPLMEAAISSYIVINKSTVYAELLVPIRLVAILETNKLKLLSFSFMRSR